MSEMLPEQITDRFLRSMRRQFYPGKEKLYFQEQFILKQAIAYPAMWLNERAVKLSSKRYQEILTEIIRTINKHGNLANLRSPGRYLLHSVQQHMAHQGDSYYEEGKRIRSASEHTGNVLDNLRAIQSADNTVPALAEAHRVLESKGGRKRVCNAIATNLQGDLFAPSKPSGTPQTTPRDSVSRDSNRSQSVVTEADSASSIPKPGPRDSISPKSLIFRQVQPISG